MPRSEKRRPKYRLHKPSGQAVVTLCGKDFYLGPHGTAASRREYDRITGEWLQNDRQLPRRSRDEVHVADLITAYWKFSKGYYVKNGKQTDEIACLKSALRYLRKSYGDKLVSEFGPLSLEFLQSKMVADDLSRGYINLQIGRIKRCFKWGVAKELVPVAVHQALTTVSGLRKGKSAARETSPVLPVDDATVDATLLFLPQVVADMVRFQWRTGCRPGELYIMRPCDVDRCGDVWKYVPESHKTEHHGRNRVIFIGPQAQDVLRPYLLRDAESLCFRRPRGGQFGRYCYNGYINVACDKAFPAPDDLQGDELKAWQKKHRWAPNRLRHSAATKIRSRYGLEAAQCVLGHSRADMTQTYAERDMEQAAAAMRQIG